MCYRLTLWLKCWPSLRWFYNPAESVENDQFVIFHLSSPWFNYNHPESARPKRTPSPQMRFEWGGGILRNPLTAVPKAADRRIHSDIRGRALSSQTTDKVYQTESEKPHPSSRLLDPWYLPRRRLLRDRDGFCRIMTPWSVVAWLRRLCFNTTCLKMINQLLCGSSLVGSTEMGTLATTISYARFVIVKGGGEVE